MSRADDLRVAISAIEDDIAEMEQEMGEDRATDIDNASCRLADLRDELKQLEDE